jgi:hypothetical protein
MNRNGALSARRIEMNGFNARTLRDAIAALTEQRDAVVAQGASFAGHLIDLAIMELRLTVHDITEEELSGLCDRLEAPPGRRDPAN